MGTHPIFESYFDCLTAFSEMSYYTILMGDLPPDFLREHVIKFFEGYGTLGGIRLMNNFGFVDFKHKRDAKDAVKDLNGEKYAVPESDLKCLMDQEIENQEQVMKKLLHLA